MTNSAVEMGPTDRKGAAAIRRHLQSMESSFRRALREARRKRDVGADSGPAARYLTTVAQGLGVIAKTRPEKKNLEPIVRLALSTLEA